MFMSDFVVKTITKTTKKEFCNVNLKWQKKAGILSLVLTILNFFSKL